MIGTRFVFGLTAAGFGVPVYALVMEHVPPDARIFQRSFFHWVHLRTFLLKDNSAGLLARASYALLLRFSVLASWTAGGRLHCHCATASLVSVYHPREHSVHTMHVAALIPSFYCCFCVAESCSVIATGGSKVLVENDVCVMRNGTFSSSTLFCIVGDRYRASLQRKNKVN